MSSRGFLLRAGASALCALAALPPAHAASVIEEVVVTATRRNESSLQDTAIAVSAFDQASLDRENIDDALDVQMSVPNVTFTQGNFSGNNLRIRGIGNNAVAASSDSGTAIAFNGAYLQTSSIFESEFFDVQRVEVLRGPQGTLYGRNTTGGVVNIIPARADNEAFDASIDLQAGNYDTRKANGMINLPMGERAALRLSGMTLERDGYVDNTFTGNDIDDRDLWSSRVALNLQPTDSTEVNFFWQRFREDDRRMRTSNQTCATDPRPFPFGLGCLPDQDVESFGVLNTQAQLGGILGFLAPLPGGVPALGVDGYTYLPFGTNAFAQTQRSDDLREVRSDFEPTYVFDEDIYNLEITQDWRDYTVRFIGTYQEVSSQTQTDYDWAVPAFSNPLVGGASTFTPTPEDVAALLPGNLGTVDANGVLNTPADASVTGRAVPFAYDNSEFETEAGSVEVTVQSNWTDKPVDFLAGFFWLGSENRTIYDVRGNTLAAVNPFNEFEPGPNGRPAPLSFFRNDTDDYQLDTWALFGEFYADVTDKTRVTVGLRYSSETKEVSDRSTLLNDANLEYVEGVSNRAWLTGELEDLVGVGGAFAGSPLAPEGIDDPRFLGFGTTDNLAIPSYRQFKDEWNELTGRFAIDHYVDLGFTDETMVYLNVARSYKSGGINPPSFSGAFPETFEPEYINSIEVGAKNRLFDGAMQLNGTFFYYDYEGLQNTKIVDRTSVNENIDAEIRGIELEVNWFPVENLRLDMFASWLDTEITSGNSIDPADPTNGEAAWTTLKNPDASVFIVPTAELSDPNFQFDPASCGQNGLECSTIFAANPSTSGDGALTQSQLVPIGFAEDLSGNQLPGAPEFSVKIGLQYSFFFGGGLELVPRVDYYWQDEHYFRVWNTSTDKIDSWSVTNASLTLYGQEGRWYLEGFLKNASDDDFVTGGYFTDASSANFTNVFLLEPRTYGLTLGARL